MKFLVQINLMSEDNLQTIKTAISGYPHAYVSVLPFDRELIANEPITGIDYIPYGSTLMTLITKDLGHRGMYFDIETANYREFLRHRNDMLNDRVLNILEAIEFLRQQPPESDWFLRPSEDLKAFSGMVIEATEAANWLTDVIGSEGSECSNLTEDTDIVVSSPKNIQAEWRYFVVDGKVVSGSMYRCHGQMRIEEEKDEDVLKEAQGLADGWLPHRNCAMDLALVDGVIKVIEFNCINSSGFYDNDIKAIFDALWEYENC